MTPNGYSFRWSKLNEPGHLELETQPYPTGSKFVRLLLDFSCPKSNRSLFSNILFNLGPVEGRQCSGSSTETKCDRVKQLLCKAFFLVPWRSLFM